MGLIVLRCRAKGRHSWSTHLGPRQWGMRQLMLQLRAHRCMLSVHGALVLWMLSEDSIAAGQPGLKSCIWLKSSSTCNPVCTHVTLVDIAKLEPTEPLPILPVLSWLLMDLLPPVQVRKKRYGAAGSGEGAGPSGSGSGLAAADAANVSSQVGLPLSLKSSHTCCTTVAHPCRACGKSLQPLT